MKKFLIWFLATAALMIGLPFILTKVFAWENAIALCFLLFYAGNPLFSIVSGVVAGADLKHNWYLILLPPLLFLAGVFLLFDWKEKIFYRLALIYLIIGIVVSLFVHREAIK